MSKVWVVMQHLYDEVKLFEPVQLTREAADAMVERLRASEPSSPDQPIEWRELEIDHRAAQQAVEHHTKSLKERIDELFAKLGEVEGSARQVGDKLAASEASRAREEKERQMLWRLTGEVVRLLLARVDYARGHFNAACWCPEGAPKTCGGCRARKLFRLRPVDPTDKPEVMAAAFMYGPDL